MIRKLAVWGTVLFVLAMLDQAARVYVEAQIEDRANDQLHDVGAVDVSISSFPFVGRLLVAGEVSGIDVRLTEVVRQRLTFGTVGLRLNGVRIDRGEAVRNRQVVLEDLDSGTAYAELSAEELSRLLPATIRLRPGVVVVEMAGVEVEAEVDVRDGALVISPLGLAPLTVPIPTDSVLPCAADAVVLSGRIRVSCTVDQIPPELVRRLSESAS